MSLRQLGLGWKLNALLFLFALWSLGNGAFIIGIPIMLYFFYRFWSNWRFLKLSSAASLSSSALSALPIAESHQPTNYVLSPRPRGITCMWKW